MLPWKILTLQFKSEYYSILLQNIIYFANKFFIAESNAICRKLQKNIPTIPFQIVNF